jgi:hypothetical protein
MPFSYFKFALGYQGSYADANSNQLGMKVRLGGLYPIEEGMKVGLDFTFGYTLTGDNKVWMISVGPAFSMDL